MPLDFHIQGKKPRAFYKVQDLEAQRFIGKCLETASKRLSAKELMLDPFLETDHIQDGLVKRNGNPKAFLNDNIGIEDLQLNKDIPETNMTITGKLNPENDTIFLKVQITDKGGSQNLLVSNKIFCFLMIILFISWARCFSKGSMKSYNCLFHHRSKKTRVWS